MSRKLFFIAISFLFTSAMFSQIVTLEPSGANPDAPVTLIFDATQGNKELVGAAKVYIHAGVVTDKASGTAWKYVKGNWGKDDGIGQMTKVAGQANKWQITLSPTLRAYFGVPASESIYRIACVFRSADGTRKATVASGEYGWGTVTSNGDIYANIGNDNYISLSNPTGEETFLQTGNTLPITAEASANVSQMKIWLNEGAGYVEKASVTSGKSISFVYSPTVSKDLSIKVTATINGKLLELIKVHSVIVRQPNVVKALPAGMKQGVNFHPSDPSKATLVLLAPGKKFVYAVGDFSSWKIKDQYQMSVTPDGQYFWLEMTGLTPQKYYVYQYWIDGELKLADPYARQVADPWNDKFIETTVFPGLPSYTREDLGIASVFRTGTTPFNWAASELSWKRPDVNHLVIYELHLRDFIASHSWQDLTDTLSYLKRLGINAIELMPVNEFEGNDSWGYNPSFFFAADKYYGTPESLKKFIQTAHQQGMAVILDIVLNHAFGQNPMLQMYFDKAANKPAANNPWFNREYVGQYQWGYDFNHESQYTKNFVDDVNRYWLEEFHFDGFRFDFTKGFTNYAPGGSVEGFDQSRINIIKRMGDKIKAFDPQAYMILEHWAPDSEESQLGSMGYKLWRNKTYDFVNATIGNPVGTFSGVDATTHIPLFSSHDEQRIAYHCLTEGRSDGTYNIRDSVIMFERVKLAAAFTYLQPGPKMIWQFDELGYDIDINFNSRTGRKPYVWGAGSKKYYNSTLRQNIYKAYQGLLQVRNAIGGDLLKAAQKSHQLTGDVRRLSFNTTGTDLVLIGNFASANRSIDPKFSQIGKWYDFFSGDSIQVTNVSSPIALKAGEWRVYTTKRVGPGMPGVVGVYENPVTINPIPFKGGDLIKIRFDATKASPGNTAGLVGADKVYMHAGVVLSSATNATLTNIIGTLTDDGIGQMTQVGPNLWELSITPNQYFNIPAGKEISRIGMWFRNGDNNRKGFGVNNTIVYFDVTSDRPILTITPPSFTADTEVTITLNARAGNRELVGADKVYMHSGVGVTNTTNPQTTAWNKVVGNWGLDDGVGQMTKVAGEQDLWQIKLTPRTYYGLSASEFPYWIAAVFRNSAGATKATAQTGQFDFGIIASNLDFFIKNGSPVNVVDASTIQLKIMPNPGNGAIRFQGISGKVACLVFSMNGKEVYRGEILAEEGMDVSHLPSGMYGILLSDGTQLYKATYVLTGNK
jgi:1,4-alpha-glucan branching enzyme